jgi:hypothetical protein
MDNNIQTNKDVIGVNLHSSNQGTSVINLNHTLKYRHQGSYKPRYLKTHKADKKGSRKKVNPLNNNQCLVSDDEEMNNNTQLELPLIGNTNL